jgi:hypothetical protein
MRKLKTVGIVTGIHLVALFADVVMALGSPSYQGGISVLVILVILGIMAPKVDYRWFDCFVAAIPIYGIVFIFRIAYRIAYLPNKDWSERLTTS